MQKLKTAPGDLQVWWVPQMPMSAFCVPVATVAMGVKLLDVLADYDIFQFKNKVKPDYCNAGGLQRWCADSDGDGTPGWEDWYDEETGEDDPKAWLMLPARFHGPDGNCEQESTDSVDEQGGRDEPIHELVEIG